MIAYLAVVLLGFLAVLLFKARGIFGAILSDPKLRAGDYDAALRRVRWMSLGIPNAMILHKEALILVLAGRSAEAEPLLRKAIAKVPADSRYPRERLHSSLGSALLNLGRYDEAERCFNEAIGMGDVTGNPQDGLAELRVVQGVEAEQALTYACQAIEHAKRREGRGIPAAYYAKQAWALASLGRSEEARESLAEALRSLPPGAPGRAIMCWHAGMVLLAMRETEEARQHFQTGRDADPRGAYGRRCAEQLRLSTPPQPPSTSYPD